LGSEFVVHVPEEYDYRYASKDRKELIIQAIVKAYNSHTGKLV
jgi:serum/glucocorticoid-regulated kinase 2